MKKITLVAIALLCSVAFTDCAAKKPVKQAPKVDPQQAYLDSLKRAKEIRQLEMELQAQEEDFKMEREARKAEKESEMEIAKLRAQNAKKATEKRLDQKLYTPCIDESYDKHGEYMAGIGIAENQMERGRGTLQANRYAVEDIATRYIGVISNAVSQYAKDVNTRQKGMVKEDELEGEATAIGRSSIEKHAETVCREYGHADDGTYTCYVAVHVPVGKMMNDLQNQMQVLQVDADRARFREFVEAELNRQAAEKEAEQQMLNELRTQNGL